MTNPSVTIWNRIEARPRSQEIDRALRSEIRDALWMLTRQWQFGEFLGEDAGSLIAAKASYRTAHLEKLALGQNAPDAYDHRMPLEANVEKERLVLDLHVRLEMGRHWLRMLERHLAADQLGAVTVAFKADQRLQFHPPSDREPAERYENAQIICKETYFQMAHAVANSRMIDGGLLYIYLKQSDQHVASDFLPERHTEVDRLGVDFVNWFERVYGQQNVDKQAWHPSHLEYQFTCTTPSPGDRPKVLRASEYHGGGLDWYSVDYAEVSEPLHEDLLSSDTQSSRLQTGATVLLPSPVSYPGMPSARFWEIEDSHVNFGEMQAFTTDTAKMVFAQFGLLYSNDWLTFPLELPLGCLAQISALVVTDVFGQCTRIPHVHERKQDEFWGLFQLHDLSFDQGHQNDSWLFLAPVVSRMQQSEAIETVTFIRDEMANMVWAIETTIPDALGSGLDGYEHAQRVTRFLHTLLPQEALPVPIENQADVTYVVAGTVPGNWIPFIPVKKEATAPMSRDVQLQRAAMPRIVPGFPPRRIRPHTSILREGDFTTPYYVYEEEVPRSGAIVNLRWKRARRHDGGIAIWLSREKTIGRGEQSSGLMFDFLTEKA